MRSLIHPLLRPQIIFVAVVLGLLVDSSQVSWSAASEPETQASTKSAANGKKVAPPTEDGGVLVCTFDHLKFPMKKGADFERKMIPKEIEVLHGKQIRIMGYILPTLKSKFSEFVLVRYNEMHCRSGRSPQLYDAIIVTMQSNKVVEYTTYPVTVEGVFTIDVYKDEIDETVLAVYHLEGESVRPLKPAPPNAPK